MPNPHCPNQEILESVLLGKLPPDQHESWEEHLAECDECIAKAEELQPSDDFMKAMQAVPIADYRAIGMDDLLAKARRVVEETIAMGFDETSEVDDFSEGQSETASIDSLDLDFLGPPVCDGDIGQLGAYRVTEVLGQGGMGIVFVAVDDTLKRRVALKVMNPSLADSESNRKRFLREAQAMAKITDDHVVTVYQVGEHRGLPFLAMQLLVGESLKSLLKRYKFLAFREVCRIGEQVALGLAAAHERGLIHRDVKPGNIWLEAPNARVKLLDFGLAANDENANLTQTGAVMGTPPYMSPEQAVGKTVDHRSDLFSLGSVLYHAITGRPPFRAKAVVPTLVKVVHATPKSIETYRPAAPVELSGLITDLLSKKAESRPSSASVVSGHLSRIRDQLYVESRDVDSERSAEQGNLERSNSRPWNTKVLGILLAIGLIPVTWFASILIKVSTENGTVFIEIDSNTELVEVDIGKEFIETIDSKDGQSIRIRVDNEENQLHLKKDGFKDVIKTFQPKLKSAQTISVHFEPSDRPRPSSAFVITGKVTNVSGFLSCPFEIGQEYNATLKLDSAAEDTSKSDKVIGQFQAISEFSFSIGNYSGRGTEQFVQVKNNDAAIGNADSYTALVRGWSGKSVGGQEPETESVSMVLKLSDTTGNVFDSDELPGSPPNLRDFNGMTFQFNFSGGGVVAGTVTSVEPDSNAQLRSNTNDREIACWILERGGSVGVHGGSNVSNLEKLPADDFEISTVYLSNPTELNDGDLVFLASLKKLRAVYLNWAGIDGSLFRLFRNSPVLQDIGAQNCTFDRENLAHLADIPGLNNVLFFGSNAGDELADVALANRSIERVHFGKNLTGTGLSLLSNCANLKDIGIAECMKLLAKDFEYLAEIPNLDALSVDTSQVLENHLTQIERMPKLKHLHIMEKENQPLASLSGFERIGELESLSFSGCDLSKLDFLPLKRSSSLKTMRLQHCELSSGQLEALSRLLPNCTVTDQ